MKKPTSNSKTNEAVDNIVISSYKVLRAVICKNDNVLFDLELNGVRIYGLSVVAGKNGDFISFPQRQGKDGKYYSIAWAKLSEEDSRDILAEVERLINS